MEQSPSIQVKYNKTSCYFCNEWLDNDGFKNHIASCGKILEKCPNNCAAYVQRKMLENHLNECPKTKGANHTNINEDIEQRLCLLEKDIHSLRAALNEEIRQRNRLISDVGNLRKHNQIADEWTNKVGDVLAAFKKCLNEETESRCIDIQQCKADINRLVAQYQQFEDYRLEMVVRMEDIEKDLLRNENIIAHIEMLSSDARITAMKICNLEENLENFKLLTVEKKMDSSSANGILLEKLSIVDTILEDHHNAIRTTCHDNETKFTKLQNILDANSSLISEVKHRLITLDFETKSIKHITNETEDKCDKLEKIVNETKEVTHKTKQNLCDLEVHLASQQKFMAIQNIKGHLIWKIDDYSKKLNEARENDITLQSPLFCNRQYGYTLRMDVNLNGIGTWKGRNIIACITVVPGDWDPLLPWPCKLKADIILRDQPDNIEEAKSVSKTIVVKKKNEQFEQNQYIHISHKTISSNNFLRNDAIFFDVRVH